MSHRHIIVNDPDDVDKINPPIYEGPANKAHEKLDEDLYLTNLPDRALIVMDSASFLIPIADVDHIPAVPPEATPDMDVDARVAEARARNEGLAKGKALGPRPLRIAAGREFRAMVAIEVAERTAKLALQAIEEGRTDLATTLLHTLITDTTTRSATEIRTQEDADVISAGARVQMTGIRERIGIIPE